MLFSIRSFLLRLHRQIHNCQHTHHATWWKCQFNPVILCFKKLKLKSNWGLLVGFMSNHSVVLALWQPWMSLLFVCTGPGLMQPVSLLLSHWALKQLEVASLSQRAFSVCLPCVCILVSAMGLTNDSGCADLKYFFYFKLSFFFFIILVQSVKSSPTRMQIST